ncbi:UNVERIFIED_CONTAM: hypothetical protein FKN15_033834 [Acipenser sinensis]
MPLQVAFGSLYRDDVLIKPSRVITILAAACMLQLFSSRLCKEAELWGPRGRHHIGSDPPEVGDGKPAEIASPHRTTANSNGQTVSTFRGDRKQGWSLFFGIGSPPSSALDCSVSLDLCLEWLLNNLMTHQSVDLMKELSAGLMEQLIGSPDLFVMQVEMDVYTALKKWMFLQLVPSWSGPQKQLLADADGWIAKKRKELDSGDAFLESEQGAVFAPVFRHVRLQYVINDLASAKIVERDAILHTDWLSAVYKQQWFAMLRTEHDNDFGPQEANKEEFEVSSMRCGRKLAKDGDAATHSEASCMKCLIYGSVSHLCLSSSPRLRLASFDGSGKVICSRSTGYQVLALEKDQVRERSQYTHPSENTEELRRGWEGGQQCGSSG